MRDSNIDRVYQHYNVGKGYYKKIDTTRLDDAFATDSVLYYIFNDGTMLGTICKVIENSFLIVSLRDYKSVIIKNRVNELVEKANENGLLVIIVPEVDIGYGLQFRTHDYYKDLIKIERRFKVNDAMCVINRMTYDTYYSFLQYDYYEDQWISGIEVITRYLQHYDYYTVISLLEPTKKEIELALEYGADRFEYAIEFKNYDYNLMQFLNDIYNKTILSIYDRPIRHLYLPRDIVNRHFNRKKENKNGNNV